MSKREKPPKGGWLPPPGNTEGLPPIARMTKKGRMKPIELTAKERKLHKRFQRAMAEADAEGRTHFEW